MPSNTEHAAGLSPVVLFCYNRPWHTQQTISALIENTLAHETDLIIYSDGPRSASDLDDVNQVRAFLQTISGFKSIQINASETNLGLATSIIRGVSEVLRKHRSVIVLEDDMVSTPDFLDYMNQALETYPMREDIFSVTAYAPPVLVPPGYAHDVYLAPRASSWGWGTWSGKWAKADWQVNAFYKLKNDPAFNKAFKAGGDDLWPMLAKQQKGVIESWAIRWTYSQFIHNAYGLYPTKSKIKNIGTDGSGTNFTFKTGYYDSALNHAPVKMPPNIAPDATVIAAFHKYYRLPLYLKIKNLIKYGLR